MLLLSKYKNNLVKTKTLLLLFVILSLKSSVLFAYSAKAEQSQLDQACESARQKALKPRKKEIYQECLTKFKKSETVCQREAKTYNGNRINGAPLFYHLPACVTAFKFRKKTLQQ